MAINDRDFALVIGIQHYPKYRALQGAVEDATDFHAWLLAPDGGGLYDKHAKLVTSIDKPWLGPAQHQIDLALDEIRTQSASGGRRFYFYFAGHGMGIDTAELALCLPPWSATDWFEAALCMTGYLKFIIELGHFQQVACFLDCCRVRQLKLGCKTPMLTNVQPAAAASKVQSFIAYATEFDNLAYEAEVAPGGPVRGHFTRALLEALRGAVPGSGNGLTPRRLSDYILRRTPELAGDKGQSQFANVPGLPVNETEWIFGRYGVRDVNVEIQFQGGRAGPIVLDGPEGEKIDTWLPSDGSWKLSLPPALYALSDESTGDEKIFRVKRSDEVQRELF